MTENKLFTIRKAILADSSKLAVLFDAYRVFYSQESDLKSAETFIYNRIKNSESVVFIAETKDRFLGFTQMYPLFSSVSMCSHYLLNDLYVHKQHRGSGIATALLNTAKEFANSTGANGLTLETTSSNHTAQALYSRNGWSKSDSLHYKFSCDEKV